MTTLYRKVLRIAAEDSPNVRRAIMEMRLGRRPPHPLLLRNDKQTWGCFDQTEYDRLTAKWESKGSPDPPWTVVVPGALSMADYLRRRATWDRVRQCVGLDGSFYEGAEVLLYPPEWLDNSHRVAEALAITHGPRNPRQARAIGCDPAEGGDSTVWAVVDELGLMFLESRKTPDTSMIPGHTMGLARRFGVSDDNVMLDAGGGGYQHSCVLQAQGHPVRTVSFGEAIATPPRLGRVPVPERVERKEERTAYKNRRAEMYGELRDLLNPAREAEGKKIFGIPREHEELRRQLAPIPKWEDEEGRMYLPPKQRRTPDKDKTNLRTDTMNSLIGCSPDEADALVLAVHGLLHKSRRMVIGAF